MFYIQSGSSILCPNQVSTVNMGVIARNFHEGVEMPRKSLVLSESWLMLS